MEDHMTLTDNTGTVCSSVTKATDSMRTDPNLQDLCDRVKLLEQKAGSNIQSDSYLMNRIRQLERSEKSLLLQLCQLTPSMQHSQRLDHKLHMLREEVRAMTQDKERGERVWRERLQRCQRQLKAKEDEMSRQSQYFETFKTQLQHKLSLAQDREQSLQHRIYTLEKQLLDMTVRTATGMATVSAVRITAGPKSFWEQQEQLTFMRGEGEGEEERKEERRKQWQSSFGTERGGGQEVDEGKTDKETEGERNKDTEQRGTDEARLRGFILSLEKDLRVLLEREEDGMTERRRLMEQLHEAQENSHFQSCQTEEMKAEVQQLKLSESSLMEEVEELREENHRLQLILREVASQTPGQSSQTSESACQSLGTSSPSCITAVCPGSSSTTMTHSSVGGSGESHGASDEGLDQSCSSAVPPVCHQVAAETTQNDTDDHASSAKSDPVNIFAHQSSKPNATFQSISLTMDTIDEFKLGSWCSSGILNLEENPSEESDALREAYRSLGLEEDLEALEKPGDSLEATLQRTQQQLQVMSRENTQLKLQLRKQAEEAEAEQGSLREKISSPSICNGADYPQCSSTDDNTILALAQDDLVLALNQENQALADRIQELLDHIELREVEVKKEETQLREHISKLEEARTRLEQENHEQGCLITELTRKTEDDLNTIMDLQQRLEESREQHNLEECVDSLVENVLNREEPQLISSQQIDDLTTASAPGLQHNNLNDSLQKSPQNTLHVSSLTDQVDQLTKSVQSLKKEQEELLGHISCLREQQKEVALSVHTQTEVKQHLTRTVWGLKEEKDNIFQSLTGLRQEKEELSRTVSGLKDSRDHFIRSMTGLKEEKEQMTETLSGLEREKRALMESLSSGKEEWDQILQSLQCSQRENDQLSQVVLNLKQERDELTSSLKYLKEQKDQNQLSSTLQEDHNQLIKSVNSLREEKEQVEHLVSCLKQEEKQIRFEIQGLRVERNSVQTDLISETQTEQRKQKQHVLNPNCVDVTKTDTPVGRVEYDAQRCQIDNVKGNPIQEQSDLMREIEALGGQLRKSQEELEKTQVETKTLHSELCQSEVRREEAERKAARAAGKVMRLTYVASQVEEARKENENLNSQVSELKSKLTGVVREKADAQSLKTQLEEQYNILTAQLRAKTVALEELNSEYIALKRGQGSKDDLNKVLMSLRTRYDDIRAKYDALKKKSQMNLDIAPLKAKLSCLVAKCQERNSLLVQMMKAMHKHGCMDSTLTQQVEQLLRDAALQDYTAAFTPGSNMNTQDYSAVLTPGFISKLPNYSSGFPADSTCLAVLPPANKQHLNGFSESGVKCRDSKSEKCTSHIYTTSESTTQLEDCSSEVTLEKNANSPVPSSPVQEHISIHVSPVVPLKEGLDTNTTQLLPSEFGPEKLEFHHPDIKRKSYPVLASLTGSSLSPPSGKHVSQSRRLSSPEKIINLHEQLQKTLKSSYQAPVSRGREQQPRKSLSFSPPADLSSASQTKGQNLSYNNPHTNSPQVPTVSGHATNIPLIKPTAISKSATLFNAVTYRSAHVILSPKRFVNNLIKADASKTTTSAHSDSSNSPLATMAPNKAKSISSSGTNISASTTLTKEITVSDVSDATHSHSSTPLTPRATIFDSALSICSDTNPKTTASDIIASSVSTLPKVNIFNMTSKTDGAAPSYDDFAFAASCTLTTRHSPKNSNKSARKTKRARPKPEAPAEVLAVEVIRTVGQSSLMIGWERPPLDELGCSNGTFVYGYRVFVDGDFHKSVMSSACTKCILENVDLSVPVHISVQTLGSNGLSSDCVHTVYKIDQN